MGFFSFGKDRKDKNEKPVLEKEEIRLNSRKYDRYILNGVIEDISKGGIRVRKSSREEIKKELIELNFEGKIFKGKVIQEKPDYFSIELFEPFTDIDFIEQNIKKLKTCEKEEEKTSIDFSTCLHNEKIRAIINLLAELEDENTTSEKLITYIRQIPELEEEILEVANSVEEKVAVEITSLNTAIARLGFIRIKQIVRDILNKKISFMDESLSEFENYEAFSIFKTIFFKEVSPLFSFKDTKNEARSLISTETNILSFFTRQKYALKNYYKNPERIYSHYSRIVERVQFGTDMLEIGKKYFVDYLGFFKYIYDGYILSHLYLNPQLNLKDIKITLSQRKLRFSYVFYLTMLATISVLQKNRRAAYILLNRLSRLGMNTGKALEFVNDTVSSSNNALSNMGLRRSLKPLSIPSYNLNINKLFPENIYFSYLTDRLKLGEDTGRVVLRHEDRGFTGFVLSLILNAKNLSFHKESFCIIPCGNIFDEELNKNMFEGFDTVVFRDIDLLPNNLENDFYKIWESFEGKLIVTYSPYSYIDFKRENLYRVLNPYVIDIPSFFKNSKAYDFLKERLKDEMNEFFDDFPVDSSKFVEFKDEKYDCILYEIIKTSSLFQ